MWIDTCYRCPLRWDNGKRCDILAGKVASVKGLGLTKIAFRCERRESLFLPGDVVEFQAKYYSDADDFWETGYGIVMRTKGRKVLIYSEDIERTVSWWYPDKIHATGESVPVCRYCGRPQGKEFTVKNSSGDDVAWECSNLDIGCVFPSVVSGRWA